MLYAFGDRTVLVFGQGEKDWEYKASAPLPSGVNKAKLLQAVKEETLGSKPMAWKDITLGDETVVLDYRR